MSCIVMNISIQLKCHVMNISLFQVGWCTHDCNFSQEEGVGDTADSYAYDGNRIRKWNIKTMKYGETWLTGTCFVYNCYVYNS